MSDKKKDSFFSRDRETVEFVTCSLLTFLAVLFLVLAWSIPIKECSASVDPCRNGYRCNVATGMCNCYARNFSYVPPYRPYLCDEHADPPVPTLLWIGFALLLATIPVNALVHYAWSKEEPSTKGEALLELQKRVSALENKMIGKDKHKS